MASLLEQLWRWLLLGPFSALLETNFGLTFGSGLVLFRYLELLWGQVWRRFWMRSGLLGLLVGPVLALLESSFGVTFGTRFGVGSLLRDPFATGFGVTLAQCCCHF